MSRGRRPRGDDSDSGIGCLLVLTLILAVMPFVGLYLLLNKRSTDEDRAMGGVLLSDLDGWSLILLDGLISDTEEEEERLEQEYAALPAMNS